MRPSSEREVPRTRVSCRVHFFLSRDLPKRRASSQANANELNYRQLTPHHPPFPHICWKFYFGIGLDQGQKQNFTGDEPNANERDQIDYILLISNTFITCEVRRDLGDNPVQLIYRVMSESNLSVHLRSMICFLQIPSTTAAEVHVQLSVLRQN